MTSLQVCAAALACIKGMTGSVKYLREMPMEEVAPAVARLLTHAQPELRGTALKTLSNLLLDTETVKVCSMQTFPTCLAGRVH